MGLDGNVSPRGEHKAGVRSLIDIAMVLYGGNLHEDMAWSTHGSLIETCTYRHTGIVYTAFPAETAD